ncbi:DUF4238 domain-containing protein [Salegentibacter agarivorans]
MGSRSTNIKQHYVPQFYSRNFLDIKGKIFVFDINRENNYSTIPKKECYVKFLYDIDPNLLKKFSHHENNYTEIIDDKIRILNEEVSAILLKNIGDTVKFEKGFEYHENEREKLYNFIILQNFRTPYYRNRLDYLGVSFTLKTEIKDLQDKEFLDLIHNLLLYGLIEKIYDLDFKLNQTYHIFFDHLINEILDFKIQLYNAGEIILLNKTTEKFITSNSPINVRWKPDLYAYHRALVTMPGKNKPVIDLGNYLKFLTIHLPISKEVSIFLFDKKYNKNLTLMHRGIGIIQDYNKDLALNLNYSTFLRSTEKVFSANDNFEKFIEMKNNKINPVLNFRFEA